MKRIPVHVALGLCMDKVSEIALLMRDIQKMLQESRNIQHESLMRNIPEFLFVG